MTAIEPPIDFGNPNKHNLRPHFMRKDAVRVSDTTLAKLSIDYAESECVVYTDEQKDLYAKSRRL